MSLSIGPRHLCVKNGMLMQRETSTSTDGANYRSVPYIHSARFLYNNKTYQTVRAYQVVADHAKRQTSDMGQIYEQETCRLKQIIYQQQDLIKKQQKEIQQLKQKLQQEKSSSKNNIICNLRKVKNKICQNKKKEEQKEKKNKLLYIPNLKIPSDIHKASTQQLSSRVQKSQKILKELSSIIRGQKYNRITYSKSTFKPNHTKGDSSDWQNKSRAKTYRLHTQQTNLFNSAAKNYNSRYKDKSQFNSSFIENQQDDNKQHIYLPMKKSILTVQQKQQIAHINKKKQQDQNQQKQLKQKYLLKKDIKRCETENEDQNQQ